MAVSFRREFVSVGEGDIHCVVTGEGPPVLLLHGFPQNHVMWHPIAPVLAERFTVVAADLRGYGDSLKPEGGGDHLAYSKRVMAQDMAALMTALEFDQFAVVGHDRGARVGRRLALDHPDRVSRLAVLDIVPTRTVFETVNQLVASTYYHWFFLSQPYDLPERLIGADPEYYLERKLGAWGSGDQVFDENALAEYKRCFADPAAIHAMCEDYRAAATIDLEHDREDEDDQIGCPVLVLWGANGLVGRAYDVLDVWRLEASDVSGQAIDAGHYLVEEAPDATLEALWPFLTADFAPNA
ncbi:MAG: alpha/beta hydrolase [Pseudomonadota bacterium]